MTREQMHIGNAAGFSVDRMDVGGPVADLDCVRKAGGPMKPWRNARLPLRSGSAAPIQKAIRRTWPDLLGRF